MNELFSQHFNEQVAELSKVARADGDAAVRFLHKPGSCTATGFPAELMWGHALWFLCEKVMSNCRSVVHCFAGEHQRVSLPPQKRPLRLLFAIAGRSEAAGTDTLHWEGVADRIKKEFHRMRVGEIEVLPDPSERRFLEALDTGKFNAVHIVGHGVVGRGSGAYVQFNEWRLRPDHLSRGANTPVLIFIHACHVGAHFAEQLLAHQQEEGGACCVVGFRWEIPPITTASCVELFYSSLVQRRTVDHALWKMRSYFLEMDTVGRRLLAFSPVLFSRLEPFLPLFANKEILTDEEHRKRIVNIHRRITPVVSGQLDVEKDGEWRHYLPPTLEFERDHTEIEKPRSSEHGDEFKGELDQRKIERAGEQDKEKEASKRRETVRVSFEQFVDGVVREADLLHLVFGDPGIGKTLLSGQSARALCLREERIIPVLFELKAWGEIPENLRRDLPYGPIQSRLPHDLPLSADDFARFACDSRRLVLLLDGWDELASREFAAQVRLWLGELPAGVRVVVTSRRTARWMDELDQIQVGGGRSQQSNTRRYDILALDSESVKRGVRAWYDKYCKEEDSSVEDFLRLSELSGWFWLLIHRPLFLHMALYSVTELGLPLPASKAEFFERVVSHLLQRRQGDSFTEAHRQIAYEVLQDLAFEKLLDGDASAHNLAMTTAQIVEAAKKTTGHAYAVTRIVVDGIIQSALLTRATTGEGDVYYPVHLSVLEYLAACRLARLANEDFDRALALITDQILRKPRLWEVFSLFASVLATASTDAHRSQDTFRKLVSSLLDAARKVRRADALFSDNDSTATFVDTEHRARLANKWIISKRKYTSMFEAARKFRWGATSGFTSDSDIAYAYRCDRLACLAAVEGWEVLTNGLRQQLHTAARCYDWTNDTDLKSILIRVDGDLIDVAEKQLRPDLLVLAADTERAVSACESLLKNPESQLVTTRALGRIGSVQATEMLIRRLDEHPFRYENIEVAEILARTRPDKATEFLEKLYKHGDWHTSDKAAMALSRIGSDQAVEVLLKGLGAPEETVRNVAENVLFKTHRERAVEYLKRAARDTCSSGCLEMAVTLCRWVGHDEKAGEYLERALRNKYPMDRWAREAVVDALGTIGTGRALGLLISYLDDEDPGVRSKAIEALGSIGNEEDLYSEYFDASRVRRKAIEAFGSIGNERDLGPLISCLDDLDPGVRGIAARALGSIGTERALEPLISCLDDLDPGVRREVAEALGSIGKERVLEPLISCLDYENPDVRRKAVEALGTIGGMRAIESLIPCLGDNDLDVRNAVAKVITKRQFFSPTIRAIRDMRPSVRMAVARTFPFLEPCTLPVKKAAVAFLEHAMRDKDGTTCIEATEERLIMGLDDEYADVRHEAARALRFIGSIRAVEPLVTICLNDEDADVREEAANALHFIGFERAVESLTRYVGGLLQRLDDQFDKFHLYYDDYPAVHELSLVFGNSEKNIDLLSQALSDESESVRFGSALALGLTRSERAVDPLLHALRDRSRHVRYGHWSNPPYS